MNLIDHIKIPLLGIASTATTYFISVEVVTEIAQMIAACTASIAGVGTVIITFVKVRSIIKDAIKKKKKNG